MQHVRLEMDTIEKMDNHFQSHQEFGNIDHAYGAVLTINLDALINNYKVLSKKAAPALCAGVVKANAYGLGVQQVGKALYQAGCRLFFVAHFIEAIELKAYLVDDAEIAILNGVFAGAEQDCANHGFIPVLNSWQAIQAWHNLCKQQHKKYPAMVQIDTGMCRLGLDALELQQLVADPTIFKDADIRYIMSHLASGDERENPSNAVQLHNLQQALQSLPKSKIAFANSGGIFLGNAYLYDAVRPGIALYGCLENGQENDILPVISLHARIIQCRHVQSGAAIGYGGSFITKRASLIATIAIGYADGWHRCLGNQGAVFYKGVRLPIIGRVSMDSITLDVTELGEDGIKAGDYVELIGQSQTIEQVAQDAGTIAYEILTSLGSRYQRIYI